MNRIRHRMLLALAAIFAAADASQAAAQQNTTGVAAIVNDYVISEYDLDQRIHLSTTLQMMTGMAPQTRAEILTSIEDEILQLQEAARLKITVARAEADNGMQIFARDNRLTTEQILDAIHRAGVTTDTFRQQIAAQLSWDKVVRSRVGANALISDGSLNEAKETYLQDLRRNAVVERRTPVTVPSR